MENQRKLQALGDFDAINNNKSIKFNKIENYNILWHFCNLVIKSAIQTNTCKLLLPLYLQLRIAVAYIEAVLKFGLIIKINC